MKIVFLCGCLEPGRDGVGDYTYKLALELINKGHQVSGIALNDNYITEIIDDKRDQDNSGFFVIRLSSKLSSEKRFNLAKKYIQRFQPDWVSLQFVIYSYHPKGLPFGLSKLLNNLGKNFYWHIMFHETWIGISKMSPLKDKVIGFLQKKIIISIVKLIQPKVITTSNVLYKLILKSVYIDSKILSIFSNIDIFPKNERFITNTLNELGLKSESELINWRIIGVFGQIHPDTKLEPILKEQFLFCQRKKLKMAFIAFGRVGHEGRIEFQRLEKVLSPNIKFLYLGEQSQENISNTMQLLNVGISSTPIHYIGKSGVFAVMKLHNVDIIIPEEDKFPEYDYEIKKYISEFMSHNPEHWTVFNVANNYLSLLSVPEIK